MKLTATHIIVLAVALVAAVTALAITGHGEFAKGLLPVVTGLVGILVPSPYNKQ